MPGAGQGILEFQYVRGNTALTRVMASNPLTLLNPRQRAGNCAWVVTGALGGGLLGGDSVQMDVTVGADCRAVLGTQASTKVYRCENGSASSQQLSARVQEHAILILAPDPVSCFAGSVYNQRQRFDLAPTAALIVVDWITSGRRARGERWEMTRCQLRTDISVGGRKIVRDALRLDAADGELASPARMGRFDCWATIVLIGPALATAADELLHFTAEQRVAADAPLIFSAGPIRGGAMVRIAGDSTEHVTHWLREHLSFIIDLAGEDPWSRKG